MNTFYIRKHYSAILAAKRGPTEKELEEASILNNWAPGMDWGYAVFLRGDSVGHPILDDQPIATSQLIAIDPGGKWARTVSRFYRLGRPKNVPADRIFELCLSSHHLPPTTKTVGELLQEHADKIVRLARETNTLSH